MIEWLRRRVEPHLRVKVRQALILSEFIRHRQTTKQGRNGRAFAALPARVVRYRERLRRQIKDLNKRGPGGTTFEKLPDHPSVPGGIRSSRYNPPSLRRANYDPPR